MRLLLLFIAAFFITSCQEDPTPQAPIVPTSSTTPQTLEYVHAQEVTAFVTTNNQAILKPLQTVALHAHNSGRVLATSVQVGDTVQHNDILFKLDGSTQKARWEKAKAVEKEMLLSSIALEKLYKKGSISQVENLAAQSKYRAALAEVTATRTRYYEQQNRAPLSGVVVSIHPSLLVGHTINADTSLIVMSTIHTLTATIMADISIQQSVTIGDTATFTNYQGEHQGVITSLPVTTTSPTGLFAIKISFNNSKGELSAGERGTINLTTSSKVKAIALVSTALTSSSGSSFVTQTLYINKNNQIDTLSVITLGTIANGAKKETALKSMNAASLLESSIINHPGMLSVGSSLQ